MIQLLKSVKSFKIRRNKSSNNCQWTNVLVIKSSLKMWLKVLDFVIYGKTLRLKNEKISFGRVLDL